MAAEEDAALAASLAGTRVLLCYGLLGEVMAGLRPIGIDYMARQRAWLQGLGVEAAPVALPTAAPVADNAARLAARILAAPSPVVLVAHSKGGLEALAALLRPGVAARCRGFLALQSPFHGSPVADAALGFGPLRDLAHHALRLARLGEGRGLQDLTCASRGAWMAEHAAAVRALTAALPVASLATAIGPDPGWRDRVYLPLARWMERQGAGPGDGAGRLPPAARRAPRGAGRRAPRPGRRRAGARPGGRAAAGTGGAARRRPARRDGVTDGRGSRRGLVGRG